MPSGEVVIQARRHSNRLGQWITFTIELAGNHQLAVVLDSGAPISAISPETALELRALGLLAEPRKRGYQHRLTTITTSGQPLPDVEVRVLPRLSGLRIAVLVGLDFLLSFEWVRFHVPTLRLFLEPAVANAAPN
jgi:hypothetical protein